MRVYRTKDECDEDERILVASRRGSSCIDDKWWRMTIVLYVIRGEGRESKKRRQEKERKEGMKRQVRRDQVSKESTQGDRSNHRSPSVHFPPAFAPRKAFPNC